LLLCIEEADFSVVRNTKADPVSVAGVGGGGVKGELGAQLMQSDIIKKLFDLTFVLATLLIAMERNAWTAATLRRHRAM